MIFWNKKGHGSLPCPQLPLHESQGRLRWLWGAVMNRFLRQCWNEGRQWRKSKWGQGWITISSAPLSLKMWWSWKCAWWTDSTFRNECNQLRLQRPRLWNPSRHLCEAYTFTASCNYLFLGNSRRIFWLILAPALPSVFAKLSLEHKDCTQYYFPFSFSCYLTSLKFWWVSQLSPISFPKALPPNKIPAYLILPWHLPLEGPRVTI